MDMIESRKCFTMCILGGKIGTCNRLSDTKTVANNVLLPLLTEWNEKKIFLYYFIEKKLSLSTFMKREIERIKKYFSD